MKDFRIYLKVFNALINIVQKEEIPKNERLKIKRSFEGYLIDLNNDVFECMPNNITELLEAKKNPFKVEGFCSILVDHFKKFANQ